MNLITLAIANPERTLLLGWLVASVLAAVLPAHWRMTALLARLATDLRGRRGAVVAPPSEGPKA